MATLEQLIIFFLLIGVGVIARKVGVITPGNTPQLTSLVFNFAMPAIILSGITTEQPHISGKDLSIVLTSAFTTLILLIICSRMLARILRYEREYYGVITVMTTFTNVSMMGIPMIYSLYGSEAMIYITVFLLPYNLLFFSYGYYCMKDQSGNTESLNTMFDFAPTINQFLQTHLFGDIFARDNLDWQSRELATVGALAATPGVEAQLLSHTRASLRVGLTAAQLRQLAQVLREHGDNDAATRADEALQKALENK